MWHFHAFQVCKRANLSPTQTKISVISIVDWRHLKIKDKRKQTGIVRRCEIKGNYLQNKIKAKLEGNNLQRLGVKYCLLATAEACQTNPDFFLHFIIDTIGENRVFLQGAPKKKYCSNLYPISALEVRFYFFTFVLKSEFWACFQEPLGKV